MELALPSRRRRRRGVLDAAGAVRRGSVSGSGPLGRGHGGGVGADRGGAMVVLRVPPEGTGVAIGFSAALRFAFVGLLVAVGEHVAVPESPFQ